MFIETKKIKSTKDIGDNLVQVEYEDDPNKDIFYKNILESLQSEEENSDLRDSQVKRCIPVVGEILEIFKKYNVRYSDTGEIMQRTNFSLKQHLTLAAAKCSGFEVGPNEDPDMALDRQTFWHISQILEG